QHMSGHPRSRERFDNTLTHPRGAGNLSPPDQVSAGQGPHPGASRRSARLDRIDEPNDRLDGADQCALPVPVDMTMIDAPSIRVIGTRCKVVDRCAVRVLVATAAPARRLPPG